MDKRFEVYLHDDDLDLKEPLKRKTIDKYN